ncbi:Predicted transporter (ABC superfamily) [Ceraceosorus bombacis]|uniref:Predicted transporter (ABC superfamily) n=1 Tax=Ceraceosorus bombacis TaxID=401625 RepID=A0A0P1B7D0_9BASI|nr:Predicted transporter (ABC superfamily) [Ceraceosorus bombacis]
MRSLGFSVGQVARLSCVADDLLIAPTEADRETVALGKEKQRSAAWEAHEKIMRTAKMLRLDRPPPASDVAGVRKHEQSTALLHTPLIRLSNGQMRRARLMDALVRCSSVPGSASNSAQAGPGALLVLSQPYNGLDAPTRSLLSDILQERHAARDPRILLFLRAQDEVPDFITHVTFIDQDGRVRAGEREEMLDVMRRQANSDAHAQGSYALVKQLATSKRNEPSLGQSSAPLVKFTNVGVKYAGKMALDEINFEVHPSTRMVLVGDNGSGKSTLLSLILGDHPQSFSIPSDRISLFGAPRSAPSNATLLLARRIGHVSPELFNAFPRKDSERGGLTVGQAIGSGFEGVFSRRALNEEQRERVWSMLALFDDVIGSQTDEMQSAPLTKRFTNECAAPTAAMLPFDPRSANALDAAKKLSKQSFSSLSLGSQSIVLLLRAAISNPALLILDEPFQHQNSHQVGRCRDFLDSSAPHSALYQIHAGQATRDAFAIGKTAEERERDALQRRSAAIIVVSHYESEWPQSISSLIRLDAGRVVERLGN